MPLHYCHVTPQNYIVLSYMVDGISFAGEWTIEMQIYRIGISVLVNFEFSEVSCRDPDVESLVTW